MATTDAALQKKQSLVEDLRQKVADVNAERQQKEQELSNDVQAAALDQEAAGLKVQLKEAKRISKFVFNTDGPITETEPVDEVSEPDEDSDESAEESGDKV